MARALLACGLVLVLAGHTLQAWTLPGLQRLEWWLYDARLAASAPTVAEGQADERLAVVDIDEASLREPEQGGEGRWPWPRDRIAALVRALFEEQGPRRCGCTKGSRRPDQAGTTFTTALTPGVPWMPVVSTATCQ
jgi:adenylate cyclase